MDLPPDYALVAAYYAPAPGGFVNSTSAAGGPTGDAWVDDRSAHAKEAFMTGGDPIRAADVAIEEAKAFLESLGDKGAWYVINPPTGPALAEVWAKTAHVLGFVLGCLACTKPSPSDPSSLRTKATALRRACEDLESSKLGKRTLGRDAKSKFAGWDWSRYLEQDQASAFQKLRRDSG